MVAPSTGPAGEMRKGMSMRKLFLSGVSTLALVAISSQGALAVETTAEAIIKASDSVKANDVWDEGSIRDNVIGGSSFKNSNGVLTVQQNNGNANRMLTAAGVNADTGALVKHISKASVQSKSAENIVVHFENPTAAYDRMNVIGGEAFTEGFARYMGILAVQQNNGDANDLGIATTVQGSVSDILGLEQTAETKGRPRGPSSSSPSSS